MSEADDTLAYDAASADADGGTGILEFDPDSDLVAADEVVAPPEYRPGTMERFLPRTLLGRQLLVIGAILGVGNVLLLQNFRGYAEHNVVSAEQRRIQVLAEVLADRVDGDAHQAAVDASPGRKAFVDWADAPESTRALHRQFERYAETSSLDSPVTTLRLRDDFRERVYSEPQRPHPNALEFVLTSDKLPTWREEYTYRPVLGQALIEGKAVVTGRYTDENGSWVTAYAPVFDSEGEVAAVVRVDAPLAMLLAPLEERQWRDARLLLLTFMATFAAVVVLVRQLGRGLRGIEEAAARIGNGDYATPVVAFGFAEVVKLARGLEGARKRVADDMRRLEGLRRTLGRRLSEAEENVDAVGRARRKKCASLVGDLRVTLEVGTRPLPAHLVDLTYDRIVVGMRKELAPDLAPGMLAKLAMETRSDNARASFRAFNDGSFEIDEMVHLRFRVDGIVALEELPEPVARVLNQRTALRVSPPPGSGLKVAVRRNKNTKPLAVDVIDISSSGVKVVLPMSHQRFSNWGSRMDVALRFSPDEPALMMGGRVRNCRALPDKRVAVGVQFDASSTPAFEKRQQRVALWVMARERELREQQEMLAG